MPCRYEETPAEKKARNDAWVKRVTQPYVEKLDSLTAMLCNVMAMIDIVQSDKVKYGDELPYINKNIPEDVAVWRKEHKKNDEERLNLIKDAALSKLTPEEREALGL
jgi:hypothetical protein